MLQTNLMEKCKRQDRTSQMMLYRKYCDGMFHVALRYVRNDADAEDVVQEAFIKAFQRLEQYSGEVTFGAWLKRIVINQSIDFLKKRKDQNIPLEKGYVQLVDDDDWHVDETIDVNGVYLAMEQLQEKYRQVVLLYLVEGYDHQEISQILTISETACRTRLLRGKGKLKELLNKQGYVARS